MFCVSRQVRINVWGTKCVGFKGWHRLEGARSHVGFVEGAETLCRSRWRENARGTQRLRDHQSMRSSFQTCSQGSSSSSREVSWASSSATTERILLTYSKPGSIP